MIRKRVFNPFTVGGPVKPEKFIGRDRDIFAIMGHLLDNAGSFAIHGEARIGKTSLLHYLKSERAATEWEIDIREVTFISFDCAGVQAPYEENFWKTVLHELRRDVQNLAVRQLVETALDQNEFTSLALQDLFSQISEFKHRPIILLDEFENLVDMESELLKILRAFIDNRRTIQLVISTSKPLKSIVSKIDLGGGKTFDRSFKTRQIRSLTKAQVDLLIKQALEGTDIKFSQKDRQFIWEVSDRGEPFKVQFAASELFEDRLFGQE